MKRNKTQKGITLIAIIITIITLFILAIVAINIVQEDGIISHTKKATTSYELEQTSEEMRLLEIEYQLAREQGNTSVSYEQYVLDKKYPGLKIGDYVNYDEGSYEYTISETKFHNSTKQSPTFRTENLNWKVLGVNSNGNIELISTNPTRCVFYTGGLNDYLIFDSVLNNICSNLYGKNKLAESARNLNVDDVTKYFGTSTFNEKYKYYFKFNATNTCIDYSDDGQNYYKFTTVVPLYLPDGNVINADNQGPVEVEIYNQIVRGENGELTISNRGNGFSELSEKIQDIKNNGTEEEKHKYNFMFKGESSENESYQWLNSKYLEVIKSNNDSDPYIRYSILEFSATHKNISNCALADSSDSRINTTGYSGSMRLRPVITLSANVTFEQNGSNTWIIS